MDTTTTEFGPISWTNFKNFFEALAKTNPAPGDEVYLRMVRLENGKVTVTANIGHNYSAMA